MEYKSPKNIKLGLRMGFDFIALVLSALLLPCDRGVRVIPGAFLLICGLMLAREMCQRIATSLQMSEWFPN